MVPAVATLSELGRIQMVRSFGLVGQPCSPTHNEITMLACDLAESQTALVSLVDVDRNWFSGRENFVAVDQCRASSFCTHVIDQDGGSLWVTDAQQDPLFSENPLVTGAPFIRFYAGSPIIVLGEVVGALCVFDPDPKAHDPLLAARLNRLARIVAADLTALHRSKGVATLKSLG